MLAAEDPQAWTEVLECESWLDNLLEGQDPETKLKIIGAFANGYTATGQRDIDGDKVSTTFAMFGEVAEAAGLFMEQAMGSKWPPIASWGLTSSSKPLSGMSERGTPAHSSADSF